jgi:hypothetical protein
MAHPNASADFPLPAEARAATDATADAVQVRVTTRPDVLRSRVSGMFAQVAPPRPPSFNVEIR